MYMILKPVIVILLITLFNVGNAQTSLAEPKPQGEYAAIDVKKSQTAKEIFAGNKAGDKVAIANQMESNLGDYNPEALVDLGIYYLSQKDFRKAVIYTRLGLLRANIDVKASQDLSLADVIPMLKSGIENAVAKLTPEEKVLYHNALKDFAKDVILLDTKTPRHYDIHWASLHSMGAFANEPLNYVNTNQYNQLVDKEQSQFKQDNQLQ